MAKLVIVESPTKARTIGRFLPDEYQVEACMGHVRDLPGSASEVPASYKGQAWAKELGINVGDGFEPLYVIPTAKKKVVADLKAALKKADALIIATDEDREGESIGWHLTQVLGPKVPVRRMVFHEITRSAIEEALSNERDIDENLVRAQEARRILDRLVGYAVSPVLWKKIAPGLSAGRVQSVAVRLLVKRERQRREFRSGSFWEIKAKLAKEGAPFEATLSHVDEKRIAVGRDFDENTGQLKANVKALLLDESAAKALAVRLKTVDWAITNVERKERKLRPYPPFTTSTLQQESNRKLNISSADTMRVAQRLYERGYITYMRTDSVNLSNEALGMARRCVEKRFGKEYLSPTPRQFTTSSKGAQEAHEAIRPAGEEMKTSDELGLTGREKSVYELIWKRTLATQMGDAIQELLSVEIKADNTKARANGKRLIFAGFMRAYVEGSDDPTTALEDREVLLPNLNTGDSVNVDKLTPTGRETRPPSRYTEAALVEILEKEGIGRPSTYATIIGTILDRDYAKKNGNTLIPTFTAFGVTQLMESNFERFVDVGFTASMERQLDAVARGEVQHLPYLETFWEGETGLRNLVDLGKENIDPRVACTLTGFDDLPARVRIGRFGPYLESDTDENEKVLRVSLPEKLAPADLSEETAAQLIQQKTDGPTAVATDPETGLGVYVMVGRYGPYVQLGMGGEGEKPKRISIPKNMNVESITPKEATLLLSLPRTLGKHPDSGEDIKAAIGRYGPYVAHQKDFRSLAKTDDVLVIDLARALELLAQEKPSSRNSRSATQLQDLGVHPESGDPVVVMDGRYGPYVKNGKINATLPKDVKPDEITLERALELIAAKIAAGPTKKKRNFRKKK